MRRSKKTFMILNAMIMIMVFQKHILLESMLNIEDCCVFNVMNYIRSCDVFATNK